MEMEKGSQNKWSHYSGGGLSECHGEGSTQCGVEMGHCILTFAQIVLRVLCGYFAHEPRVMFENNVSEPMVLITAILPGSNWSVLLLRNVMQDAMRCVFKIFVEVGIRVYVDDMRANSRSPTRT